MLTAEHIRKQYRVNGKSFPALDDVSLSVGEGEFHAIVGESGSGKSTLAHILCGLLSPDEGSVTLDGTPVTVRARRKNPALCSAVQLVLQNSKGAVDPHFTAYDTIAEPIRNLHPLPSGEERKKILALAGQLELPEGLLGQKARILSGGQLKRVAIARAMAADPELLILDEAVSGMDVLLRKNILDLLIRLHRETGKSFLLITHDIDAALYAAEKITVMRAGKIREQVDYAGDLSVFRDDYSRLLLRASLPTLA